MGSTVAYWRSAISLVLGAISVIDQGKISVANNLVVCSYYIYRKGIIWPGRRY